ncbi:MAG TPA: hypothetical protein VF027_04485 [Sphingomicrobium sp.]
MTRARRRAFVLALLVLLAAVTAWLVVGREPAPPPPRPAGERPPLLLLTSLPLLFGEDFSVESSGSPALKALETRYRIIPISVTDAAELNKGRLLLMAQPPAQRPEDLVALDKWVRRGGRVLLLADPALDWPSKRPLGDPLRPPQMFTDTGLLAHWGLLLDAPDERGPAERSAGGYPVATLSPGVLGGRCDIGRDGFVARCRIGNGRATIIADADFLDVPQLGAAARHNLDALLFELGRIEGP